MFGGLSDNRKIGIGLTCIGVFFLFLGVMMLFDSVFLAFGNFLFLVGTVLMIGPGNTVRFFARREKLRGTACFLGGMFLVLIGWSVTGMFVEAFGVINLFGNFFPVIITFLTKMPIIGTILEYPPVARVLDKLLGESLPMFSSNTRKGSD